MIEKLGIGIDIVNVGEFKKIPYSTNKDFYKKIFLKSEIEYCIKYKNYSERFAGKFAIKEAVKKSIHESIQMKNIQTSHSNSKPSIDLIGKLHGKYKFLASLSHEHNLAVAIVISEKIL